MKQNRVFSFLFYCTLSKGEYNSIRPLIWERNRRILGITSLLAAGMAGLFLLVNRLTGSPLWIPYAFLLAGSILIFLILKLVRLKGELWDLILCYGQMLMVCLYAGILSTQQSNYGVPATSIVVFIALLPLTVDDRPIRMYGIMLGESAAYLTASHAFKSPDAFSLDILNIATFCVVGMILYSVICTRNVREIYQGVRMEKIRQSVISSLATVVEERDESTGGHILRTEEYVCSLIGQLKGREKYAGHTEEYWNNVILAAPMHDVGKIRVPDAILNKPGRLTTEEYEVMKRHAPLGARIIQKTMADVENESYFTVACNIAKYHHERYDGTGYPLGLKGEDIPLEARIMALADVYDALVSERVYKKPYSKEQAVAILKEGSGTQFDPDLVQLFLKCIQ